MCNRATREHSRYRDFCPRRSFASSINVPDDCHPYTEFLEDTASPRSQHSVPTKQDKCYDPHDKTLTFVDGEDDLDFLYEGFKSPRAQMSCGHAVTPTSLTNWCRRLLDQGESRFVCGGSGCSAEWTFAEVCKMALLDSEEKKYFRKTLEFNIARQKLTTKLCPECRSTVTRENESNLNVLCKECTAVKGRLFEFCWQCLREWKGPRPRKDRCENDDCCNESLETLKKCPDMTFHGYEYEYGFQYLYGFQHEYGVRVCPSVRACPTCGLLLQHSKKGCPSVVCSRCDGRFCFVCLKHSSTHYSIRCTPAPRQTSIPVWKNK